MLKNLQSFHKNKVLVLALLFICSFYSSQIAIEQLTTLKKTKLSPFFKAPVKPYSVASRLQNKGKTTTTVDNKSIVNRGIERRKSTFSQTSSSKLPKSLEPSSNVPVEAIQPKSKDLD